MRSLMQTLRDYDAHLLTIIGNRWDVDFSADDARTMSEELAEAMHDASRAEQEWSRLSDEERGAMQMLLASSQTKMPAAQFERLYGEIRQMGPDKRQRDKPHLNPDGLAERLYYRGLISTAFDQGKVSNQLFVYVPDDLASVLPVHQTGFDLSEEPVGEGTFTSIPAMPMAEELVAEEPGFVQRADTLIVDDMTSLLAYLQLHKGIEDERDVFATFLGPKSPARLRMLVGIALELALIDDMLAPERTAARKWLEGSRHEQMHALILAWQKTYFFDELWQVPSLKPDDTGWEHDPTLLRDALRTMFEILPGKEWVSLPLFIEEIKETEPDFQRPGGDYDSWYIRDANNGQYLNGFETWNAVEGTTLFITVIGPLHWLGMVDLGRDSVDHSLMQTDAFRMTAYGRAWAGIEPFPQGADQPRQIELHIDGTIMASRVVSRYDRFQLARVAELRETNDPYIYHLTGSSLNRAARQGIEPGHIESFLRRASGGDLPPSIDSVLGLRAEAHSTASSGVTIRQMVVLEVETPEQLQYLWETPSLRRYLGKRLGQTAVMVRSEQAEALIEALEEQGIGVNTSL